MKIKEIFWRNGDFTDLTIYLATLLVPVLMLMTAGAQP